MSKSIEPTLLKPSDSTRCRRIHSTLVGMRASRVPLRFPVPQWGHGWGSRPMLGMKWGGGVDLQWSLEILWGITWSSTLMKYWTNAMAKRSSCCHCLMGWYSNKRSGYDVEAGTWHITSVFLQFLIDILLGLLTKNIGCQGDVKQYWPSMMNYVFIFHSLFSWGRAVTLLPLRGMICHHQWGQDQWPDGRLWQCQLILIFH